MVKKWIKKSFFKKYWTWGVFLIIFLLMIPYLVVFSSGVDVTFNQHYIESLDSHFKAASLGDKAKTSLSFYTLGLNGIFNGRKSNNVDFYDHDAMFDYLFDKIPNYAVVYPTEMYYYYLFSLPGKEVSGNLRLVELPNGKLGMGYFDRADTSDSEHKMFGFEEGLRVNQLTDNIFKVSYNGKTVFFNLNGMWKDPPEYLDLLPEEEFVSKVRDESGVIFYMLFNTEEKAFYYVLDEEREVTENLEEFENNILIGGRTGFAYYYDESNDRKVLFGISRDNIRKNNYFDGPFDQVYPLMDLRGMIYETYPYTQFGGGIDKHGNFLDRNSVRVAISPYLDYERKFQLSELVEKCEETYESASGIYACLTYEDKRDFHKDSPLFNDDGTLKEAPDVDSSDKEDAE